MSKGKWFLTYIGFDSMENRNPIYTKWKSLQAQDEVSALEEARQLWSKLPTYEENYCGVIATYPHSPRVIYEVTIDL